ncbi:hypothetical protein CRM22_002424 [Opisthorchis felineus]|uniref:Lengsin n=1 Tax=Opisthorchis felineus TaxID=147828 RepID=A0A4S2M667_OPIFE|nr:hypothetical protein CRM22_002424 [Opisthorchis felineus]TGZ71852.1 hypothetical protein CRM22_002424 [Opisthorchis felineus]TGZ71853.1 hypothetical protein CRM22_002424 [Opisthorchis felineus]
MDDATLKTREDITDAWKKLSDYDFIRLLTPDINGIHLGKLIPIRHHQRMLDNRYEMHAGTIAFGPRFEYSEIPEVTERNHESAHLIPIMDTLFQCPWVVTPHGERVCGIICEQTWKNHEVLQAHPRTVARRMIKVLEDRYKLRIYAGYEPEFRIFRKEGFEESSRHKPGSQADTARPLTPWTSGGDMLRYGHLSAYEFFIMDMDQFLQAAGIDIIEYLNENGSGELETPLVPKFGIAAADTYFIFKHAVREIAKKHDMRVSFMTKPLVGELSTGCHFNHSLWDIESGKNVLFDSSASDNLSNLAHNWLGGLFEHMPALTALCSPTVNCYRRLHTGWAPGHMDWELDNRLVTVRLKNVGEDGTYLENRISSSASCPYHVMAATLAAGMDGIERRLEPPSRGAYNPAKGVSIMKELPKTLKEAIDALKKDTILADCLGNQFVDWFIRAKEFGDLKTLEQIDVKEESEDFLAQERYEYLEFI